jgi:hypothetical protein
MPFAHLLAQTVDDRQQAFLRSLNESTGSSVDSRVLAVGFALVVLVLVGVVMVQRRKKVEVKPARKFLRHRKKLMKEVAGAIDLSPSDVRKLEHHAGRLGIESPLTLLLCPSVLKKPAEPPQSDSTSDSAKAA